MNNKNVEFENKLTDLITETFETKEEIINAIIYFKNALINDYIESALEFAMKEI